MTAVNYIKQIKKETLPMKLVSFSNSIADVMPKHNVEMNRNPSAYTFYETERHHVYKVKPTSDTTLAHHAEIERLNNTIMRLQHEKSVLVKWVAFLF
jgi:hypothetical protein